MSCTNGFVQKICMGHIDTDVTPGINRDQLFVYSVNFLEFPEGDVKAWLEGVSSGLWRWVPYLGDSARASHYWTFISLIIFVWRKD